VRVVRSLYGRVAHLRHEVAKFGSVGLAAFVIDAGLFNYLVTPEGSLHKHPLTAKAVSTAVAATFAYFANRHWTWRHRSRTGLGREYFLFFVVNLIGLGIADELSHQIARGSAFLAEDLLLRGRQLLPA